MLKTLSTNREFILNSTVPREDFVLADLFMYLYKFLIELTLCWLLSVFYGFFAWSSLALAVPLLIAYAGFVLGTGLLLCLFYSYARDMEHIWRIASRLFLFITLVFYMLESVSARFGTILYWVNSVTPFLISLRQIVMWDNRIHFTTYLYSLALGCAFMVFGYYVFSVFEHRAAERA